MKVENMENKKNNFWKGALCGALAMFLTIAAVFGAVNVLGIDIASLPVAGMTKTGMSDKKLAELERLIDDYYLYSDDVTEQDIKDGIYSGVIGALGDPYSVYYDKEGTKSFQESSSGEYVGIGAVMSQNMTTNIITISQVYDGSPAQKAGIQDNDILYKVNGKDVIDQAVADVVNEVRGEAHTTVEITVLRGDDRQELTMEVERDTVQVETVVSSMKEDNIGYIRITEFDSVTYEQFEQQFLELEEQGMEGLVVDLRSNPGGSLLTVTQILDLLLPEGKIVYTQDKNGKQEVINSDEEHQFKKPIAVLVNEHSASASEIFAGAIQDYEMGPIVGTTTFGKGIVQRVFTLADNTSLTLTIAEYFTPNGRNIHKKGIEPDIRVEFEPNEENPQADNQMDAALNAVREKIGQ